MKQARGFSLIEIMVVLVIIGLLASIIGPRILGTAEDARKKKVLADFANVETALKLYKLDNYVYPSTEQGLHALVEETTIAPTPKNFKAGGYMEKLPKDPWGNEYIYVSPGDHGDFDIYSLGADGQGEETLIGNWQTDQK
ncbi:MAG: type II secretion system major pseudopilin GspG [Cellvibrionales bacterium]|nr:type II secretion system major pseudopilin GspG [Cellvibrionales bacterium]